MTLEELLRAYSDGTLSNMLDGRPGELTPQLAGEARETFKRALSEQDLALAQVSAGAAAQMWLHLGDRPQAIKNYIDFQQLRYMAAQTPPQYEIVRGELI